MPIWQVCETMLDLKGSQVGRNEGHGVEEEEEAILGYVNAPS